MQMVNIFTPDSKRVDVGLVDKAIAFADDSSTEENTSGVWHTDKDQTLLSAISKETHLFKERTNNVDQAIMLTSAKELVDTDRFVDVFDTMWERCEEENIENVEDALATWTGVMDGSLALYHQGLAEKDYMVAYHNSKTPKGVKAVEGFLAVLVDKFKEYSTLKSDSKLSEQTVAQSNEVIRKKERALKENDYVLGNAGWIGAGQQNVQLTKGREASKALGETASEAAAKSAKKAMACREEAKQAFVLMWDQLVKK